VKLWYLDNEYSCYVVMAATEDDAWEKLRDHGILPPDEEETEDENPAYHDIIEVVGELKVDNPNDLTIVA